MQKEEQINYLNNIKSFLNLKAICEDYNQHSNSPIDYNNLRAVLNGISKTRLSEEKLGLFITYLYTHLYSQIFDVYNSSYFIDNETIHDITNRHINEMTKEILKELNDEFQALKK